MTIEREVIKQSNMEIDSNAWASLSLCLASARDWCTRYGVTLSLVVKGGKFEAKAIKHEPMPGELRSSRRWKQTGTGSAGDVIQALMREVQRDLAPSGFRPPDPMRRLAVWSVGGKTEAEWDDMAARVGVESGAVLKAQVEAADSVIEEIIAEEAEKKRLKDRGGNTTG